MKEKQYIDSLFEKARKEKPETSFEEVSAQFTASLDSEMNLSDEGWVFNKLYFFPLILFILGSIAIAFYSNLPSKENQVGIVPSMQEHSVISSKENAPQNNIAIVTETEEIQNEMTHKNLSSKVAESKLIANNVQNQEIATRRISEVPNQVTKPLQSKKLSPKENNTKDEENESKKEEKPVALQKLKTDAASKTSAEKVTQSIRNQSELELILESALNAELLKEELFVKNGVGEFHQLVIQTNRKFDDLIDIQFEGKKVIIIASRYSGSFNIIGGEFIDVQDFNVSENKAFLAFIYNSIEVKIDLIKRGDEWFTTNASKGHQHKDHAERQSLIQLALDHDLMEKIILTEENGTFKSIAILANGHFSNMLDVNFDGKNLEIVPYKYNRAYDRRASYVEVTSLRIKRKKATLKFSYNKDMFQVDYRMKNEKWSIRTFTQN